MGIIFTSLCRISLYSVERFLLEVDLIVTVLLLNSYSTVYTMFPVFSLVLDKDVSSEIAMTFPELYKELTKVIILALPSISIYYENH